MADAMKMLIEDCQKDFAPYLPPESGIAEHQLLQGLNDAPDGLQAQDAHGGDRFERRVTVNLACACEFKAQSLGTEWNAARQPR